MLMRRILVFACGALPFVAPGVSHAAGGPVPSVQGRALSAPGGTASYVAIGAGHNTLVKRVRHGDGKLERSIRLAGSYGVALAAPDGSTTGLSSDGRTLVLSELPASYTPERTTLVVLDTGRLTTRTRIALRGFYTVDAISPTGRWLYLIHYLSPNQNPTSYEVRAYDVRGRHLTRYPVIDPRDRGEAMLGVAVTRAMSADGRWAYTLYDRQGSAPFIHALDTERRRAVCVDLPHIKGQDVFGARLTLAQGGGTLGVERSGAPIATVDTRTFAVRSAIADPLSRPARRTTSAPHGSGLWLPLGAALVAVLAGVALVAERNRRPSAGGRSGGAGALP
jgi:hypothetical protein